MSDWEVWNIEEGKRLGTYLTMDPDRSDYLLLVNSKGLIEAQWINTARLKRSRRKKQ